MAGLTVLALALYFLFIHQSRVSAIPREDFFRFGTSAGDNRLSAEDNVIYTRRHFLQMNLLDRPKTGLIIDVNGRIAYFLDRDYAWRADKRHLFRNYTIGTGFSRRLDTNVIPFYANIDISESGGSVYYRYSTDRNDQVAARVERLINDLCPIENFRLRDFLVVTWDRVGYYERKKDHRNTFQCLVATTPSQTFAFFLYNSIQWTRAKYQQYLPQVGFHHERDPGFRVPNTTTISGIKKLVSTSNIGIPGVWAFKVSGRVYPVGLHCFSGDVTLSPSTILYIGNPVELNCSAPQKSNSWRWTVGSTHWKGNETLPGFHAQILRSTKMLFSIIPMSANNTVVYCSAVVNPLRFGDHRQRKNSNRVLLTIRGFPSSISNLNVQFRCPAQFQLSWELPSYFNFSVGDTICVYITDVDTTNPYYRYFECGIHSSSYSISAPPEEVNCTHTHNFTVDAINWAGLSGAPAVSVFLAGTSPPTNPPLRFTVPPLLTLPTRAVTRPESRQDTAALPPEGLGNGSGNQPTIIAVLVILILILVSGAIGATVVYMWRHHRIRKTHIKKKKDSFDTFPFSSASSSTGNTDVGISDISSDSEYTSSNDSWGTLRPVFM